MITMKEIDNNARELENEQFNEVYLNYKNNLLKYFILHLNNYEDAKDLLQETYIKIYRYKEKIKEVKYLNSWIYTIAHNELVSFYRKKSRSFLFLRKNISDIDEENEIELNLKDDNIPTPEEKYILDEKEKELYNIIKGLPDKYRTVLLLKEVFNLNYEEISSVLNCKIGTVQSRLSRAREKVIRLFKMEV